MVATATATRLPPRTFAELLRGRIRAAWGLVQLERARQIPPSRVWPRPADLVGIVSQADLATNIDEEKVGDLVEIIESRPM